MTEHEEPKENRFQGTVRPLAVSDLSQLKPILETWIRFPTQTGTLLTEEVEETLEEMKTSAEGGNDKKYFVAENPAGHVVGVLGYQPLRAEMLPFSATDRPLEVINAYADIDHRKGKGVGKALLQRIEDEIRNGGHEEFLLNSGPRYRETGWPFWTKMLGAPVGTMKDFYGPGNDAPVWRKVFNPPAHK